MPKRVLVIGGTGMLGHVVYYYLKETNRYEVLNTVYRTKLTDDSIVCDVRNQKLLKSVLRETNPYAIINCVGALIKESKTNPANAIYLNAMLPHVLRKQADLINAKLIHVSTDCVFSGTKGNYGEEDFRDADDVYGRSKALGEICEVPHCTLRTSIIGPELKKNGTGLLHWFMNESGPVQGYTHSLWSGVTTLQLAKCMEIVITKELTGLFHVTNGRRISKFDLLKLFNKVRSDKIDIIPFVNSGTDKSLQASSRYDFQVPTYRQMIAEMNEFSYT